MNRVLPLFRTVATLSTVEAMVPLLSTRYFDRLALDPSSLDSKPTFEKLKVLQEQHLAKIPFENASQHGLSKKATLDQASTVHKILECRRGGFCFELNGLFGAFLKELGYEVAHVPAQVFKGSFDGVPTHVINIVRCHDGSLYYVDVGFGEPPIHPLFYDVSGSVDQTTPEGMVSKLVHHTEGEHGDGVVLYWMKGGTWTPRLKWNYESSVVESHNSPPLEDFHENLATVLQPDNIFSQKLITCLLTKDLKITLAGNKLKITGNPRFPEESATVSIETLDTLDSVRQIMHDRFGIPLSESHGLDLSKSLSADPVLWSQM